MNPHGTASMDELSGWFAGRIPADWFAGTPEVLFDRDEILVDQEGGKQLYRMGLGAE